jgi:DNA-binding NtrC family response regulator
MLAREEITNQLSGVAPQHQRQVGEATGIERILIVDDSPSITAVLGQILEIEGFQTQSAYDAQDGYWTYLDFRPDLIITDVYMPGQSGPEMMRQIRKHEPGIRTIYMSGCSDTISECFDGKEDGNRDDCYFLQKPFSRTDLLRVIAQFSGQDQ